MKYEELYRYGVRCLEGAGIGEASLDARLLLEYVCHTDRNQLLAHGEEEVDPEPEAVYRSLLEKRAAHMPLQYMTGTQEFMGLAFIVNENVLIPRQDTEILVEEAMRELHDGMSILDLCTGSGCILLSLLRYSNDCKGVGVDCSRKALEVARRNAGQLSLDADFRESDLCAGLDAGIKFDMLVSNPPYIPSSVIPSLAAEVRVHEPREALDAGEDGLHFYRRISREAKPFLYRGAPVFLEIGYNQGADVMGIFREAGYGDVELVKDYAGNDRVVKCIFVS